MTKLIAARSGARRTLVALAALTMALATFATQHAAADTPTTGGPRNLLITYRSEPANRPAFRAYLHSEERAQLDKLKREGVLESYQILFNPFVTSGTWDAMTVLTFKRYADTQRWRELERMAPGGLTPKGLRLAKPVDTYSADLAWTGGDAKSAGSDSVFYVIPYEYSAADQYRKYVDGYVIPQVTGWIREGVLANYRIFMNRSPVGPTWDALFIYQYRDLEAFGRRDETVAKVRKTLVDDPAWKALSDIKQTIRTESENTVAESLTP
jgi:hypothetical protein